MTPSIRFLLAASAVIIAYELASVGVFGLHSEPWGDEGHFIETSRLFVQDCSIARMADYPEVVPPLPFVIFGLWGRAFGDSIPALRICAMLIAAIAFALFAHLARSVVDARASFIALATLLINPYTFGLALFVFTDMAMVLALLLFIIAIRRRSSLGVFVAAAAGLLTRQYFVFATLAAGVWLLLQGWKGGDRRGWMNLGALALAHVPLALLVMMWHGMAPPSGLAKWNAGETTGFHGSAVTLYGGLMFVFVIPAIAVRARSIGRARWMLIAAPILAVLYWIIPVRASEVALAVGRQTVGLVHRALLAALHSTLAVDIAFCAAFVLGGTLALVIIRDAINRLRTRTIDFPLLLDLLVVAFFLVMPLSYQVWEKYFIPLVPVVAMRLLMMDREPVAVARTE